MARPGFIALALVWLLWALPGVGASSEAPAPQAGPTSEGVWDWEKGEFRLILRVPLPKDPEAAPPKLRYLAEQDAQRLKVQEFVRRAGALPVASGTTLAERMVLDPGLEAGVVELGEALRFVSSRVDESYSTLEMVWSVGLWDGFGPLITDGAEPNPVPPQMVWAPSRDFSGLVIFAMGDLAWQGTGTSAPWQPSLSFRLLNPRGEVVFDPSMSDPTFARRWGQAATSLGRFNEDRWRDRIGFDPLRIVARGVWGARPGDLILSEGDWARLLSRDANRRLLAEGRVLVLYGPFPDYVVKPNPDSAIDPNQPPIQVIPQPPLPSAEGAAGAGGH